MKRILCVLLSVAMLLCLTACGESDGLDYLFRYNLSDDPQNLDPQLAQDEASLAVIANIYCGLLKTSGSGGITTGAASSYTVSSDGMKYEFTIDGGNCWSGVNAPDEPQAVTAQDFEFAFLRLFNPDTRSPYREDFECIKNARAIIDGEIDYTEIGVEAKDEKTLVITLDYPNANFLSLLTTTAAMPCNEDFFYSTKGKYGLDPEDMFTNGAFYVKQWEYDPYGKNNHLILRRNTGYSATETVSPYSINFFIINDMEENLTDFEKEEVDCIVVSGDSKLLPDNDYNYTEYISTSYGFVFGSGSDYFDNCDMRTALSQSIDRQALGGELSHGRIPAYALVPSGVTMLNKSYRELDAETAKLSYNPTKAKEMWDNALAEKNIVAVGGATIILPESFGDEDDIVAVAEQWQINLGFFCGVEVLPDEHYYERLETGDFDIALYEVKTQYNSPASTLSAFSSGDKRNVAGYSDAEFDGLLDSAQRCGSLNDCVKIYSSAEKMIIDDAAYVPVFYQSEYLVYPKEMAEIRYNPFTKQIDFADAKNYD